MLPASTGVYVLAFWLGPLGLPLVFVGLPSALFHAQPGIEAMRRFGVLQGRPASTIDDILIAVVSGVVWMGIYGLLGLGWDRVAMRQPRTVDLPRT
jgi:hypothetical protein